MTTTHVAGVIMVAFAMVHSWNFWLLPYLFAKSPRAGPLDPEGHNGEELQTNSMSHCQQTETQYRRTATYISS